jgi:hypothetical protein
MKGLSFLFVVSMMCFTSQMMGQEAMTRSLSQTEATSTATKVGAFGEVLEVVEEPIKTSKKGGVRHMDMTETETKTTPPVSKAVIFHGAKEITKESGFYIQLKITNEALDKTNAIFQEFGNLRVQEMDHLMFCYLIGNFITKDTAQNFLKSVILERYPEATIIELKEGQRVN